MHELGLCSEMVKTLLDYMKQEKLTRIDEIELTVGEATGVVPSYMYEAFPAVVQGTKLEGSKLKLNMVKATGVCKKCGEEFALHENHETCPFCGSREYDIERGFEYEITRILAK